MLGLKDTAEMTRVAAMKIRTIALRIWMYSCVGERWEYDRQEVHLEVHLENTPGQTGRGLNLFVG